MLAVDLVVGADVEKLNGVVVDPLVNDANITGHPKCSRSFLRAF